MKRGYATRVVLVAAALTLTSCSAHPAADSDLSPSKATQTATVQRATIVGVLTLNGTVVQGIPFDVHTTVGGTVAAVGSSSVTVRPPDGSSPVTISPSTGTLERPLVKVGDVVVPGMAVAAATATGFTIRTELQPADLLRFTSAPLGARAQIKGGEGPFNCPLVDPVPTSEAAAGGEQGNPVLLCSVPPDARVIAGMSATVVIQLEKATDALVLPVAAVAGTIDSGHVYLRGSKGEPIDTKVKLGTTDGVRIVITEGVKDGDVVFVPGPWLGRPNE